MSNARNDLTICEWCGKGFKDIDRHKCKVKALAEEAPPTEEEIQDFQLKGKSQVLEVRESATAKIKPDQFWAWTEGLGIQIRLIIDSFTGVNAELREINKTLEAIKNNLGNSYLVYKEMQQSLNAINTTMADVFEIWQHGKIIDEDRQEELKVVREVTPGITQEEADLKTYEELVEGSKAIVEESKNFVHYEQDSSLPEHTRKIKGTIDIITPKAIMVKFFNGKDAWIPKSTIKGEYQEEKEVEQFFIIDSWVLIKNGVIAKNE